MNHEETYSRGRSAGASGSAYRPLAARADMASSHAVSSRSEGRSGQGPLPSSSVDPRYASPRTQRQYTRLVAAETGRRFPKRVENPPATRAVVTVLAYGNTLGQVTALAFPVVSRDAP